jgi:hypothetical protein
MKKMVFPWFHWDWVLKEGNKGEKKKRKGKICELLPAAFSSFSVCSSVKYKKKIITILFCKSH